MSSEPEPAELLAFPSRPEDRLRRALRKLEAALEEQGSAVAGFRADLSALSGAVMGLGQSLQGYRNTLAEAGAAADQAHAAARLLEARADAMLRK